MPLDGGHMSASRARSFPQNLSSIFFEFCKVYRKVKIGELLLPTSLLNATAMGTCSAHCQLLPR